LAKFYEIARSESTTICPSPVIVASSLVIVAGGEPLRLFWLFDATFVLATVSKYRQAMIFSTAELDRMAGRLRKFGMPHRAT